MEVSRITLFIFILSLSPWGLCAQTFETLPNSENYLSTLTQDYPNTNYASPLPVPSPIEFDENIPVPSSSSSVSVSGSSLSYSEAEALGCTACDSICEPWSCHIMPDGLIYTSYLAGGREPRMRWVWNESSRFGSNWEVTLGGRVGILRYGNGARINQNIRGWQLDLEGAAFPRLSQGSGLDVIDTDYRIGFPLTYSNGAWNFKVSYYHISAHIGDEYLLANPTFNRINFSHDGFVFGADYYTSQNIRFYGEFEYRHYTDGGFKVIFFSVCD
jgi:hypothetical protein